MTLTKNNSRSPLDPKGSSANLSIGMEETRGKSSPQRLPSRQLYFAAASALLGGIAMGCGLAYPSPLLFQIRKNATNETDTFVITDDDTASWVGSIMTIGALIGGLLIGPTSQGLGRRMSIITVGVPFVIGWFLIAISRSIVLMLIGRFLSGIACGLISGIAPLYVVEISTPEIRGFLGTCFQVNVTIGILIANVFGYFTVWTWLAVIMLLPAAVMSVAMFFMPETPPYLMSKYGRTERVENSLRRLRNSDTITDELDELQESASQTEGQGQFLTMDQWKRADIYKPAIYACVMMILQQFSGINAVIFYMSVIFEKSLKGFDPNVASIIVCIAQVVATIGGSLMVDRLGRKVLLMASGIGHVISLTVFGFYYYKSDNEAFVESYTWLPILCIAVFIISFSIGWGPIPWMMIPEMLPTVARGLISSLATAINWTCAFIVSKNFDIMQKKLSPEGTFWLFSVICALSIAFVWIFLPETKGKSFEEIQQLYGYQENSESKTEEKRRDIEKS